MADLGEFTVVPFYNYEFNNSSIDNFVGLDFTMMTQNIGEFTSIQNWEEYNNSSIDNFVGLDFTMMTQNIGEFNSIGPTEGIIPKISGGSSGSKYFWG